MLSPLSPWNDFFINLPMAYGIAFVFSLFFRKAFLPALIIGYWFTNLIGLLLMHQGISNLVSNKCKHKTRTQLIIDLIISLIITAALIILIKLNWLKLPF